MPHKVTNSEADKLSEMACIQAAQNMVGPYPAELFVNQLLTKKERITIGRRVLIAQAILQGKTRMEINEKLQVSPNTFTQIKNYLASEFPEYSAYLKQKTEKVSEKRVPVKPFTYDDLKRKYPMHFLLFSLANKLIKK